MRDVALTAAVFVGALIVAPAGAAVTATSDFVKSDANSIHTIINKPTVLTDAQTAPTAEAPKKAPANAQLASASSEKPAPAAQAHAAIVQPGDTLTVIAQDNGTTYGRVYDANPAVVDPDLIYPTQELHIPAPDEQLAARPLPENAPAEAKAEAAITNDDTTVVTPAPAPVQQQPVSVAAPVVADGSVWDRLAMCEATGNWAISTGNGFYGGLQFTVSSWAAVGGSGMPNQASREEQIMRGQMLQARQGWGAWPACAAKLGLL
jgi:LysM repeat protein